MNTKKEEREIANSFENETTQPEEAKTINFESPETLVGQKIDGRFWIEKDLTDGGADAGGIGLVYLARDLKLLGKLVVVKILQKSSLENKNAVRKFQHEKEALMRLESPNIVRILDLGTLSDGNPFMVMEFIEGYSLRRKLRENKKLSFDECAYLIENIGNALNAAHSRKILHRDIKPENIMLTPQEGDYEFVRLIDFGIARVEDSKLAAATTIPQAIGTVRYMAPEQLEGKLDQTAAVDIYSFALVAYEILTGELAFNPRSIIEMHIMQSDGLKKLPSELRLDLPEKAENVLLSGLDYDPGKRPHNARIFGRDLANALRETNTFDEKAKKTEMAKTVSFEKHFDLQTDPATTPAETISQKQIVNYHINQNASPPETLPSFEFADSKKPATKNKSMLLIGGLAFCGLLILSVVFIAQNWLLKNSPLTVSSADSTSNTNAVMNSNSESKALVRKMRYWLEVQKMRNGKNFEAPFESSGREIFENGYKFRLHFTSSDDGYFYLFNQGKDSDGKLGYFILFPVPGKDSGTISRDSTFETDWNKFGGAAGTEKIWLIWTKDDQDVLKDAAKDAFSDQDGKIADEKTQTALRSFLDEYSKQKLTAQLEKDDVKNRTVLNVESDKMVYLLELEHR